MTATRPIYKKNLLLGIAILFIANIGYGQVQASFTADTTAGCAPSLIKFSNTSTGSGLTFEWDFGNGVTSTLPNPSTTYFNAGTFTVTLIAKASNGQTDTLRRAQYITIYSKPIVNFTASDTIGCFPLTTQFTNLSQAGSGTITSNLWDFGDGTNSTNPNPTHTYPQGIFNVVLRVTNDKGCATTIVKNNYIKAQNGVVSGFTFNNPNTCASPVTINFTNTSTGTGILAYSWNFGDGGSSTLPNPSHTYATNGSYTVSLTTTNNQGCTNTYTLNNAISVGNMNPNFSMADSICVNSPLNITNTSTPIPVGAAWTFGDGSTSTQINPVKIYTVAGTYPIKLLSDFGACKDSITKSIVVLEKPISNFNSPNPNSCKAPHQVNFVSSSVNAISYNWSFGDGGTSTQPNPSYTYTAAGNYDVTLVTTNALGCTDTLKKVQFVKINLPTLSFINLPDSGCNPLTITPLAIVNAVDGIATYQWNFGDGFVTNNPTPSHQYTVSGIYTVTLTVTTNGGCVDSIRSFVKVGTKPNVQFTANPRVSCAFEPIQFTDQSTGSPATSWYWQFGDGGTSIAQNPIYQYQDTGYFTVTLIVGNNGCYDTLKKVSYIFIKPPIARFASSVICTSPYNYSFTDQSIAPLTWAWDFGDGNNSNTPSPTHTYTSTGLYDVKLTVTNGACSHFVNKVIRVIDENADFVASARIACKNSNIDFSSINYKRSNINAITWDFGDGVIVAGDSTISHKYTQSGIYTVQLIMTDLNGCIDTIKKDQHITIFGPTANFISAVPGSCLNTAVLFNDQSTTDGTHAIQNWQFNYGDGTIQNYTAPPFQHQYSGPGNYSVTLKVTDNYGCSDSITKVDYLVISRPLANFASIDTLSCPGKNIVFTNTSSGPGLQYSWSFGDGVGASTAPAPSYQYTTDGVYNIQLAIIDQFGCKDTLTKNQYINISSPFAKFTPSDTFSTCPPLFVAFTDNSSNAISRAWDFGDGAISTEINPTHFYTSPGVFVAKLTVTSNGGCTSVYTKTIKVLGPTGSFTYGPFQGCNPLTITLNATTTNATNYVWDYNNGQTVSTTSATQTYTYTQPGKYLPRIILKDDAGCSIPVLGTDSITVFGVTATITASKSFVCDSGLVSFNSNAISNDVVTSYLWKFGDGSTSSSPNPTHNYTSTGNYPVTFITTTQQGCKDTADLQLPINVYQSPIVNIIANPGACIPATAQFNGQIIRNDTSTLSWTWNFGNGQNASGISPSSVIYNTAGSYTVTSIATSSNGCVDTATAVFNAWALPSVDAGIDKQICRNAAAQLLVTGASNYLWSPSNGLTCTNCPNPTANPDTTRMFYVVGTDGNGCKNKDSVIVNVVQKFVMKASPNVEFCAGKFVTLFANGAAVYNWSPSAGLSATTGTQVVAKPNVTTTYKVIGTDSYNCFTDSAFVTVKVNPTPTVNAGNDQTIGSGGTAALSTTTTGGVNNYNWSPTNGLTCFDCPNPIASPAKTTNYTVEVKNAAGCKSSDEVTVFVLCDNSNLFIPNTFSPNNDGMNDIMYPRGNGIYSIKSFKIFNRWGELMYEQNNFATNDPSKGWDGTYKGKKLSPDVFVYTIEVLCANGTPLGYKGNISLIQ